MEKLTTKNFQLSTEKRPKVFFATDHAGFQMKEELLAYARDELEYEVEDCGAYELDSTDDYPEFMHCAARAVSKDPEHTRAIIFGGSGQGEAMTANRYKDVRATVYYGEPRLVDSHNDTNEMSATNYKLPTKNLAQSIIALSRQHNNANILSIGARFISIDEAKQAVKTWLSTEYVPVDRHERRIKKIDILN